MTNASEQPKGMTLADHAEAWTREQGKVVPERDTPEWRVMYDAWIEYAFEGWDNG